MASIGKKFLDESSYATDCKPPAGFTVGGPPFPPSEGKVISLPQPDYPDVTLEKVLNLRRSHRRFTGEPISLETLSWLLWACAGVTDRRGDRLLRTTSSAGATYALETLVAVNFVTGLDPGVYCLNVERFALKQIISHSVAAELAEACSGQKYMAQAAVNLAWAMIPDRITARYAERAYRYIFLDAGHLGQSLHLAAEAVGLGCCAIGSFRDAEVNQVLGVPSEYPVIYLGTVGVKG